jgi:hypothetical protein
LLAVGSEQKDFHAQIMNGERNRQKKTFSTKMKFS